MVLPLELVDQSIGSPVWVVMKNDQEFSGTLLGLDDFVNIVLENAIEHDASGTKTSISKLLLHGRNVAMLIPGGVEAPAAPEPSVSMYTEVTN